MNILMKIIDFKDVKTQKDAVLWHLQNKEKITSWEAIKEYGVTRLAATIFNLKSEGYKIISKEHKVKNRFGRAVNVAVYHYIDNPMTLF